MCVCVCCTCLLCDVSESLWMRPRLQFWGACVAEVCGNGSCVCVVMRCVRVALDEGIPCRLTVCICMYVYVCIYICMYVYVCICVCMYVCMCVHSWLLGACVAL